MLLPFLHDEVSRLLRLAQEMKHHLRRLEVEIKIHLGAAQMRVRRTGVPNTAGLEQLSGLTLSGLKHCLGWTPSGLETHVG